MPNNEITLRTGSDYFLGGLALRTEQADAPPPQVKQADLGPASLLMGALAGGGMAHAGKGLLEGPARQLGNMLGRRHIEGTRFLKYLPGARTLAGWKGGRKAVDAVNRYAVPAGAIAGGLAGGMASDSKIANATPTLDRRFTSSRGTTLTDLANRAGGLRQASAGLPELNWYQRLLSAAHSPATTAQAAAQASKHADSEVTPVDLAGLAAMMTLARQHGGGLGRIGLGPKPGLLQPLARMQYGKELARREGLGRNLAMGATGLLSADRILRSQPSQQYPY